MCLKYNTKIFYDIDKKQKKYLKFKNKRNLFKCIMFLLLEFTICVKTNKVFWLAIK